MTTHNNDNILKNESMETMNNIHQLSQTIITISPAPDWRETIRLLCPPPPPGHPQVKTKESDGGPPLRQTLQ
jgi:hypothetical protein